MKKALTILLIMLIILPLYGCWGRREIGELPIVMGLGIDKSKEPGKIRITSQIANPSASTSTKSGGSNSDTEPFIVVTEEGYLIFPTVRRSALTVGRRLYMAHNQVIIFGEDIAREGISRYMDWFIRDPELRLEMYVLIADGEAKKILDTSTDFNEVPAMHMVDLINAQEETSTGVITTAFDVLSAFTSDRKSAVIPVVGIEDDMLKIREMAVFRKDKMVGKLTDEEGNGLLWMLNKFKRSVIEVKALESTASVEIYQSDTKITPNEDGSFEISINIKGNLGSERGRDNLSSAEGVTVLQKSLTEKIESDIKKTLKRASQIEADICGFSEIYYKKFPREWEKRDKKDFLNPKININVTSRIFSGGRIIAPVQ